MHERKVILVDYEIQEKILSEIESLKRLLIERAGTTKRNILDDGYQWMETKDLMRYLQISRRTTLSMRQKGLPYSQVETGKLLCRKDLVDTFISSHKVISK